MLYKSSPPSSRINITLDLEQDGAKRRTELPLHLLVLDNFSLGKTQGAIAKRKKIKIQSSNLDPILEKLQPSLNLTVPNKLALHGDAEMNVHLKFQKMADFRPERIVSQVPALQKLVTMRALLKELRCAVTDNVAFRKVLQKIMQDPEKIAVLKKQLPPIMEQKGNKDDHGCDHV